VNRNVSSANKDPSKNRSQVCYPMYNSPPRFCSGCGEPLELQFVAAEDRERLVCTACAEIHYINPKVVAGVVPVQDGSVWLLRRAIQPRFGSWTFPAGFMEMGETVEQAACRETYEELHMDVRITRMLNIYSRPESPTVLIVYLADALTHPAGGSEALEFASFAPHMIPWHSLAFWNTEAALRDWVRSL
jgi:ADP-ribose pyrophosphatase YjhB (NUDIX family)